MAHHNDLIGHNTSPDRNKTKSLALPFRLSLTFHTRFSVALVMLVLQGLAEAQQAGRSPGAKFPGAFWGRYTREVS